jgi:hypothetical protein
MSTKVISTAAPLASQHVGRIGDRVSVQGVIRSVIGRSGVSVLHVIADIDGNEFEVRRIKALGTARGLVSLEATVEGHAEFRGVKRTKLSPGKEFRISDDHAFLVLRR